MQNSVARRQQDWVWIKKLIWTYFFLLIFEGVLRKWVLPSQANALLLIRDPIVIVIYFLAWRSRMFPRNIFISLLGVISFITLVCGLLMLSNSPLIALYGFRTNFIHLPLIFLIAKTFNARDVERVGYWVLVISIPMAILMAFQFLAPGNSFINAGAGENSGQIGSALGRIRAAGTFSFIIGPAFFYSLVMAFLLHSQYSSRYPFWLVIASTLSMICAAAVSGSRGLLAGLAVVFVFGLLCSSVLKPQLALRLFVAAIAVGIMSFFLAENSVIEMGLTVFERRIHNASSGEGGAAGFLERVAGGYTGFIPTIYEAPLFGSGLGMGTNAGLSLMADKSKFIWFENEWSRHVLESGPILGIGFIFYRVILTIWIGLYGLRHSISRDPLPLLLFGAGFLNLMSGSLGQTTTLGFVVSICGLSLAATFASARNTPPNSVSPNDEYLSNESHHQVEREGVSSEVAPKHQSVLSP